MPEEMYTKGHQTRLAVFTALVLNQTLEHKAGLSDSGALLRFFALEEVIDFAGLHGLGNYLGDLEFAGYLCRDEHRRLMLTPRGLREYKGLLDMQARYFQRKTVSVLG